ncbi:hypothetical protein M8J77_025839 [Diaphorina citri]|nr:hypothetical protein M8J77_025839 [Diaphorina citri]
MKLHLFKFHDYFDCLLGIDNLLLLDMVVDLKNSVLKSPLTEITIHYRDTRSQLNHIVLAPQEEQIVSIDIPNIKNGDCLIPHKNFGSAFIPEGILRVKNNKAICTLVNNTESQTKVVVLPIEALSLQDFEQTPTYNSNLNTISTNNTEFDFQKIRMSHMNSEEEEAMKHLINKYQDIFHSDDKKLTFTNAVKHHIHTTDEVPVHTKTYRYPHVHKAEVQQQIQKMLDDEIIRPSNSPWSSPLWVVPKKMDASGKRKWRIVIDYRKLNEKTVGDRYPLPNINDLLDKLGRCHYFSTLDLASGFYQIEVDEASIPKTAFSTEHGHFEFLRLPMGMRNSPATFQRVMEQILRGLINNVCVVYLDDILVFGTSLQEHVQNLRLVFERLKNANLKLQMDKCEFLKKDVDFLGHVITPQGVKPNPKKIEIIRNYPIPKTPRQIKAFLGLLSYYRKFIKDFATLTKPLTKRLKKFAKINIQDPDYKECFEMCKNLLSDEPILQYPDFTKPFNLTTDASNVALGAVLSQGPIGSDRPVAYASRTLNDSECNYSTIEKELLAIVWAVKYFRPYLYGQKFKIITDHRPLQWLFSIKEPSSKLIRWRLKLEEYDYEIIYKKGSQNTNADTLSRLELNMNETTTQDKSEDAQSLFPEPDPNQNMDDFMDLDKFVDEAYERLCTDENVGVFIQDTDTPEHNFELSAEEDDPDLINTVHSSEEHPLVGIPISEESLNVGRNQIILSLSNTPKECALRNVKIIHKDKQRRYVEFSPNNLENQLIDFLKTHIAPKVKYHILFKNDDLYKDLSRVLQKYFKNSQINIVKCSKLLTDVTEEDKKTEVIKNHHDGKTNHRGIEETCRQIREKYYWPNITKYVQDYINHCEICQKTKYDRNPLKLTYNITPTTIKPFEVIHADTISLEKTKFLTLIDPFSKFAQAYMLRSAQASEIVDKLLESFSHHGIPSMIVSDNGCEFKNSIVREFLSLHKINVHFTSSQHPESNGVIERFHSTLIEHIRLLNNRDEFKRDSLTTKVHLRFHRGATQDKKHNREPGHPAHQHGIS